MTERPADAAAAAWNLMLPARRGTAERHSGGTTVAPEERGYEVVNRPEPPPIPNGWYAAASSSSLPAGAVVPFIAVGHELVAFRGRDGAAHVLDAFCPHMGAHLGGGSVQGDTLTCPYHAWRFAGDGRCVEIPYSDTRIPARACVRSYPVREQDGLVLFWYHAAGSAPNYEVPTFEEADHPDWSGPVVFTGEMVASLQDMAENNVDYTHFRYVHGRDGQRELTSEFRTDGPFSTVVERFTDEDLSFTRFTRGPGLALLRIPEVTTVLAATTPIDRRHVQLLWHFYFPAGAEDMADAVIDGVVGEHGLGADLPIWRDKVFWERPLIVKGDGPIAEFRRWYEQFYEGSRQTR